MLAAGFGSRLGRDKAGIAIRGRTLLQRTVATLRGASAAGMVPIRIVVIRALRQRRIECPGVEWRINAHRSQGISASIRCALRATPPARAVMLLAVDLPHLAQPDVMRMLRQWRKTPDKIVARRRGSRAAMPVILPKRYFDMGGALRADHGLGASLASVGAARIRLIQMPSAAIDIDTWADVRAARRRLMFRGAGSEPLPRRKTSSRRCR